MITKKNKINKKISALKYLEKITGGEITLSEVLLTIRENENISQKDFSDLLEISKQKLCDIEKGRRSVSTAKAAKFAIKLGHPPEFFIELALKDELRREGLTHNYKVLAA